MNGVDEVDFPSLLAYDSSGGPRFSTLVTTLSSGYEGRQQQWQRALLEYDAAPAIHDEERLALLLNFFYARKGRARGFLFRDRMDYTSNPVNNQRHPSNTDQTIATGDGVTTRFLLIKTYTDLGATYVRRITRPVANSVQVTINNSPVTNFSVSGLGYIDFSSPPANGASIKTGFEFRVPVRFNTDSLDTSIKFYQGYETVSVPLIEIREA